MTQLIRSKTTDLSELRQRLIADIDDDTKEEINKFKNESLIDSNKIENDDKENQNFKSKSLTESKLTTSRPQFMVTRINTKHTLLYSREQMNNPKIPIYRSVHYNNIVNKEDKINKQLLTLQEALDKEIVARTATLCEDSIREARQLVQNSLATSRIINGFVNDFEKIDIKYTPKLEYRENNVDKPLIFTQTYLASKQNISMDINQDKIESTNLSTRYVDNSEKKVSKQRTDHQLDSTEPHIRVWLEKKNRENELERREKAEENRIKETARIATEAIRERRQEMSERAFLRWMDDKKEEIRLQPSMTQIPISNHVDNKPIGYILHNSVFKRTPYVIERPKTTASFNIRRNVELAVCGKASSLQLPPDTSRHPVLTARHAISYTTTPFRKSTNEPLQRPQTAAPSNILQSNIMKRRRRKSKIKTSKSRNFNYEDDFDYEQPENFIEHSIDDSDQLNQSGELIQGQGENDPDQSGEMIQDQEGNDPDQSNQSDELIQDQEENDPDQSNRIKENEQRKIESTNVKEFQNNQNDEEVVIEEVLEVNSEIQDDSIDKSYLMYESDISIEN